MVFVSYKQAIVLVLQLNLSLFNTTDIRVGKPMIVRRRQMRGKRTRVLILNKHDVLLLLTLYAAMSHEALVVFW